MGKKFWKSRNLQFVNGEMQISIDEQECAYGYGGLDSYFLIQTFARKVKITKGHTASYAIVVVITLL